MEEQQVAKRSRVEAEAAAIQAISRAFQAWNEQEGVNWKSRGWDVHLDELALHLQRQVRLGGILKPLDIIVSISLNRLVGMYLDSPECSNIPVLFQIYTLGVTELPVQHTYDLKGGLDYVTKVLSEYYWNVALGFPKPEELK